MRFGLLALALVLVGIFQPVHAQYNSTYVQGYTRSNGTYVQPHYRSNADSSVYNNYSTQGNVNPYTGQRGTVNPYSSGGGMMQYATPPQQPSYFQKSRW